MKTRFLLLCILANFSAFSQSVTTEMAMNTVDGNGLGKAESLALLTRLWTQVEEGKLKAYSTNGDKELSLDELNQLVTPIDTFYVEDPNPPHTLSMKVVKGDKNNFLSAVALKFEEEWEIEKDGEFEREVKWIMPELPVMDPFTGELRGTKTPFRLKNVD